MMFKIYLGFALAFVLSNYGDAIKCYVCNSDTDPECMKSELSGNFALTDCNVAKPGSDMCVTKMNTTDDGTTMVVRDCASLQADLQGIKMESCLKINGDKFCHCFDDGCNNKHE